MKLNKKIEEALNRQVNQEIAAAYAYLAAGIWLDGQNLKGFAKWMGVQRQEELEHAQRVMDYVQDRAGHLVLDAVAKPKVEYTSVMEIFQAALASEEGNTRSINELYKLALAEDDYATQSFLKWFIDEQVEEERIMSDVIGLLEHAGSDRSALLVLNQQLGSRTGET